jgi:hypothetical protein
LFAQVLPGLRDIRAPLAAGYLWMLSIWLLVADSVPDKAPTDGVLGELFRLGGVVSTVGTGIALSFLAYIVGALSLAIGRAFIDPLARRVVAWQLLVRDYLPRGWQRFSRRRDPELETEDRRLIVSLGGKVSRRAIRDLSTFVRGKLDDLETRLSREDRHLDEFLIYLNELRGEVVGNEDHWWLRREESRRILEDLANDLDLVATRLIDVKRDLYSEYDRLRSEADFRYAISLPIAMLLAVLAIKASPWWWIAEASVLLLFADGVRLSNDAGDALAGAVRAETAQSGVLERLNQRADDFLLGRKKLSGGAPEF